MASTHRISSRALKALPLAIVLLVSAFLIAGCVSGVSSSSASSASASSESASASSASSSTSSDSASAASSPAASSSASAPASSSSSSAAASSASASAASQGSESSSAAAPATQTIREDGAYTSKEDVALYIHTYGHLPPNYISKTKARRAGWEASEGNLWDVLPGMSIGGSTYYNDDGKLPDAKKRTWTECDIDYEGGYRNAKRIVFSNDGLIFYTEDHYETFEQLY